MRRATTIRIAGIVLAVLALEAAFHLRWIHGSHLYPPSTIARELMKLSQSTEFWAAVRTSARGIVIAFAMAIGAGCAIGVILHNLPRFRAAIEPLIASYYALPFFVLYPLLVVLMGLNQAPIILIGFLYAVMAMIVGALNGLDRIPLVLRRTSRMMHLSDLQQAFHISLPAAAPYLFTGAKLALGYSITGVLGSEFILADSGFGYQIAFAYNNFEDLKMYALLLFLLVVVSALTILLHWAERSVRHRSGPSVGTAEKKAATRMGYAMAALGVLSVLFVAWQLMHLRAGSEAIASPVETFAQFAKLIATERFWGHISETLRALALAILVSCVLGILVGVSLGQSALASETFSPVLVTLYALPKVALYPLVLLFVGIGFGAKVVFGAMYGTIPMILIAMNAVRSMNPSFRRTADALRLSAGQRLWTIVVPAVVPEIVAGVRVSFSITLLGVMIGEMFAANRGLGFVVMNSINVNDTATMMSIMFLVSIFAVAMNTALLAAERRFNRV
jgi:ABC-type nitrate/sulfonate/bicarbonate transport system permease component